MLLILYNWFFHQSTFSSKNNKRIQHKVALNLTTQVSLKFIFSPEPQWFTWCRRRTVHICSSIFATKNITIKAKTCSSFTASFPSHKKAFLSDLKSPQDIHWLTSHPAQKQQQKQKAHRRQEFLSFRSFYFSTCHSTASLPSNFTNIPHLDLQRSLIKHPVQSHVQQYCQHGFLIEILF